MAKISFINGCIELGTLSFQDAGEIEEMILTIKESVNTAPAEQQLDVAFEGITTLIRGIENLTGISVELPNE